MLPKQEMCFEYYPLIPSDASSSARRKICSNFLHSTAHPQAQIVVFFLNILKVALVAYRHNCLPKTR